MFGQSRRYTQIRARPFTKKATKQAKSTPTTYQKTQKQAITTQKTCQICKNGLGLLSKTHTLTPPRQAISLLALAATGVRTYATTPKQKAKPHRAPHCHGNLYKLNTDGTPRISTNLDGIVVGVDPENLKLFIDDILCCFNEYLKGYLE